MIVHGVSSTLSKHRAGACRPRPDQLRILRLPHDLPGRTLPYCGPDSVIEAGAGAKDLAGVIRFKPRPTARTSPPSRFPRGKHNAAISVTV
jgi:hypothetical protein